MSPEMHRHFHDELSQLKEHVLEMSGKAEQAVGRAVDAFISRDREMARSVIIRDADIDTLEVEIGDQITNLLARHQPVARDLRLVLAALKISNDVERVGDHAVNIAQSARTLSKLDASEPDPELGEMAQCAREMLASALTAFVRGDAALGREVCRQDDRVDALHRSIFQAWMTRMGDRPEVMGVAMEFMRVSRNLERVADLATNIAEDVVFLVEGTNIAHGGRS